MEAYKLYKEKKEGILSKFPFGVFAFARLDDRLKDEPLWKEAKREQGRDPMGLTPQQPNIEFFTTEASHFSTRMQDLQSADSMKSYMVVRNNTPSSPLVSALHDRTKSEKRADTLPDNKHTFSMITELFSPRSRGTVSLKSTDPLENPVIDCNYLSDPLDLLVLSEGCRFGNEIVMKGAGTKNIVKGSWPAGEW